MPNIDIIIKARDLFSDVTKRAQREMSALGKSAATLRGAFAIGSTIGIATGAIVGLARATANYGDAINEARQQTGLTAQQISGLKYALEQSNSSLDEFMAGFKKFAKDVSESSDAGRDLFDVLLETADEFKNIEDGAARAALAQTRFGRSGLQLLPFLTEGRQGILRFTQEAERMGLVIDEKAAKASDEFNDSLGRLGSSIAGLAQRVIGPTLPTLTAFVDVLGHIPELTRSEIGLALSSPELLKSAESMNELATAAGKLRESLAPGGMKDSPMGIGDPRGARRQREEMVADMMKAAGLQEEYLANVTATIEAGRFWNQQLAEFRNQTALGGEEVKAGGVAADATANKILKTYQELVKLEDEAGAAFIENQQFWNKQLEDFRNRTHAGTEDMKAGEEAAAIVVKTTIKRHEDLQRNAKHFLEEFRRGAGHVWDDFFIRGQNVLASLSNFAKGLLNTIGRNLFQNAATAILGGRTASFAGGIAGAGSGLGGGLLGLLGLGGTHAATVGAIGTAGGTASITIPGAGLSGAFGLGGAAGLLGLGSLTIPVVGGIAAGVFLLGKHFFGHRTQEAPFTSDPLAGERNRTIFAWTEMRDAARDLRAAVEHLNGIPPREVVVQGMPSALQGSNQFRRDMNSLLYDDV